MTTTNDKIRGLLLSALMVMSVVAGTAAFAGTAVANHEEDYDNTDTIRDVGTNDIVFQGQIAAFTGNLSGYGETITLYDDDGGYIDEYDISEEGHVSFSTADREGQYHLGGQDPATADDGDPAVASFQVVEQSFPVSPDSTNLTTNDNVSFEVGETNRATEFMINVTGDAVATNDNVNDDGYHMNVSENSEYGNAIPLASDVDTGEYDVNFDVVDTTASETMDLNVSEAASASETTFTQGVFSNQRGDDVEVTINLSGTSNGKVYVGSSDVNYRQRLNISDGNDDDNQVTVVFNTYADGMNVSAAADEDSAEFDESYDGTIPVSNSALATGNYELNVTTDENNPEDSTELAVSTLSIGQRSTDGAESLIAPGSASFSGDTTPADVTNAVVPGSTVAQGDWAVVEVDASGIYAANEDPLTTDGLVLNLTQENPGVNAEPAYERVSDSTTGVEVIPDAQNNTLYGLIDTSTVEVDGLDDSGLTAEAWNATFTVVGGADATNETPKYKLAGQNSESVSTTFDVEETSVTINDGEDLRVSQGEYNISGTTNLAPDSTLVVEARAGGSFLKTQQVTVGSDGNFAATYDFSDVDNGTEFTVSTRAGYGGSVSAVVDDRVEGNQPGTTETTTDDTTTTTDDTTTTTEDTTTTTEDTTTTTDAPDTETETTTTEEETTTDNGGNIPGFGMMVSLVALVAAALLALRRSN